MKTNLLNTTFLNFKSKTVHILTFLFLLMVLISCNKKTEETTVTETTPATSSETAQAAPANPPANFKHAYEEVNGVKIHYVIGGKGDPLVLVHGFGQNWYMWNRLLPELSKHFTVIAPDLRGVGESDKPEGGYDKKNMAKDIHELVKKLGYNNINLAGHDIGLMVAYAYAAQYGSEVKKLALMDALLPGIEPVWSQVSASAWWFGFFAWPASGDIVKGKEKEFLTNFWPMVGHVKDPFTAEETAEFVRAYAVKDGAKSSFKWFGAFPQDGKDNLILAKTKLKMPLLAMGGEYFAAAFLKEHSKLVAENVTESKIAGSGHWLVQENTAQVQKDLLAFFLAK
ncbi:alpha/beta fold hydrolase [Flavobacterium pectinovorum]|jgi:pimeloyl-ACP methyl ester carboxylesterase|uniref:Alpha/beta hydrolase n=1 Tax=Flavobacterium pectinovorum TaxID=29533 RepID=A0AB36NYZ4_9FLAO|nr:alpha/beta hydrolase [Flavobacterium pectinovorum]OXB03742.1 alpha/beta hydrolase [Flavobacterium pectinovorum]SHL65676.1 Pimeloyl-ACP methyl ester carboxylesterase [Flavobacterium pectinovorum]